METATESDMLDCLDATVVNYEGDAGSDMSWNRDLLMEVTDDYSPGLRIYLSHNLRNYEDIDDLMQELYIRVMMYPDPSSIRSLKAFVFTIAANLLRDKSRRSCTRVSNHSISLDDMDIPVESDNPERILEDQDTLKQIEPAIGQLPTNCRKAFIASRFEDKSYKEIALGLGVSVSMVEKHIIEALKQLRQSICIC